VSAPAAAARANAPAERRAEPSSATLRIGMMLPAHFCFSRGNGVRQEALFKQRGLAALGHRVELLSPWTPVCEGTLDVVHFFYGGLPLADIAAARQVAPRRLVFSTTIDSNQGHLAYRLAALLGSLSGRLRSIQGEFRRQARLADAVVVRSRHERERVVQGLGIDPAKVHLVHLGIDLSGIDARRARAQAREGIFHLSTFGQPRKNVQRLIAAVGPTGIPLTIAGSCPPGERQAVELAAAAYPNIRILGFLSPAERDELYYRSRVFALPSLHEGTGLAALEAAARGCAVVITRNGGPPDYFDGIGRLVDPYSVPELRAAIVAAHRDRAARSPAELVATRFDERVCAQRLVSVYRG
jgi:glycosyltransferase involved in cell wall biosynthesis